MQRALLFNSNSLEKTSSISFRDNVCIFVGQAGAHGPADTGCPAVRRRWIFSPFYETMLYIHDSKRRDPSEALLQQGLLLTDRTVHVSTVKIFRTLMSFCISLFPSETHWKAVQHLIFSVDHLF